MAELLYFGKVDESGVLHGIPKTKLKNDLKSFAGKNIEMIIRRKVKHRSYQQNRLWWLYMTMLGDEIGYTKDEMHDICKMQFLAVTRYTGIIRNTGTRTTFSKQDNEFIDMQTGEIFYPSQLEKVVKLTNPGSTAKLTTVEFMELIDKLVKWAIEELNITLPSPQEQIKIF